MQKSPRAGQAVGEETALLGSAGLSAETVASWLKARPRVDQNFDRNVASFSRFWRMSAELRAKLPAMSARNKAQVTASSVILQAERQSREQFLGVHVETVYRKITNDFHTFVRAEQLVEDAAVLLPGLVPAPEALIEERGCLLKEKDGLEIDQGIFFSHVMRHPSTSRHLCHAMLRPRPEALDRLPYFRKNGAIDLGAATVLRMGKASVVEMRNPGFLNALDDTTLDALETAVDLAILDLETRVAVLRGGLVEHRNLSAGVCFQPASISLISITAKFHTFSTLSTS